MTSKHVVRLAVASLIAVTPLGVLAASPHWKHGGQVTVTATVSGATANAVASAGLAAGIGNENILVVISLSGSAGTFCHNKGNPSLIVPGQNPALGTSSTAVPIDASAVKNGNLVVPSISTSLTLATPSPDAAGCPNDQNWTVTLGETSFSGHYSFQQPPGTEIPSLSGDFPVPGGPTPIGS